MSNPHDHHISVCICTFRRPELLHKLLSELVGQQTDGLFTYSVVVADNDSARSAESVVAAFSAQAALPVTYCVETQQNIAMARNKALEHAQGDFVAFIDDDEFPVNDWLLKLFHTCEAYQVEGVLGPVKPYFEEEPPAWLKKGKFFDRPDYATGYKLNYSESRTGNVLFRSRILQDLGNPFAPEFDTAGEDVDFFRRMMGRGGKFIWCTEAVAYEIVPAFRCTRSYLLKRALLRGSMFPQHKEGRIKSAAKSLVAVPCYIVALPILALCGEHYFLNYLIKLFDHGSRLLAYLGLPLRTERET